MEEPECAVQERQHCCRRYPHATETETGKEQENPPWSIDIRQRCLCRWPRPPSITHRCSSQRGANLQDLRNTRLPHGHRRRPTPASSKTASFAAIDMYIFQRNDAVPAARLRCPCSGHFGTDRGSLRLDCGQLLARRFRRT